MSTSSAWTISTRRGTWELGPSRDGTLSEAIRRTRQFVSTTPQPVNGLVSAADDRLESDRPRRRVAVQAALLMGLMVSAMFLSACNTVDGTGEDLQEASDNTKDAIDDATD